MRTEFRKAIGDVEDEDDQSPVCGTFDLEVAKKGVGTEEIEGFIYDVVLRWVAWGDSMLRAGMLYTRWYPRTDRSWAPDACPEGQDGEVSYLPGIG